jgi:hypothetical protein
MHRLRSLVPLFTGFFLLLGVGVYAFLLGGPPGLPASAGAVGTMLLLWSPFGLFHS